MGFLRSEEEVDKMIEEMKRKSNSKYLTQGITFNKESEHQMAMLKFVLMRATSFSAFGKKLIAEKMEIQTPTVKQEIPIQHEIKQVVESTEKRDTGNFLL